MMAQFFSQRTIAPFIVILFFVPTQFAYATPPSPPCFRYYFVEVYSLDASSLPAGVSLLNMTTGRKTYFLKNASPQPLIVQLPGTSQILKLVNGKNYTRSTVEPGWYEHEYSSDLYTLARINKKIPHPNSFGSDTQPSPIAPVRFTIAAQYDGQLINITGTLSYVLYEYDCAARKKTSSFWTSVLELFASFKFW